MCTINKSHTKHIVYIRALNVVETTFYRVAYNYKTIQNTNL